MTLGSLLAQTVFPALLPPADGVDFEYYDVLKLRKGRSTTVTDVRKAYKLLSLQLHPDKIAQRGGNREEAAALYERVQEAADVLSDDSKRRIYISYNYSVARYRFVHDQHGWMNPTLLLENLKQAHCVDRTRLWCVTVILLVLILLQPILIAVKVNSLGSADSILSNVSWYYILIPFWIVYGMYIILRFILMALAMRDRARFGPPKSSPAAALGSVLGYDPSEGTNDGISDYQLFYLTFLFCESVGLLVGIRLLVAQWERPLNDKAPWLSNAVPFYGVILFIVIRHLLSLRQVRYVQATMISIDYVRIQHGVDWDEATEEQRATILQNNIVVQPDPAAVVEAISLYREVKAMEQLESEIPVPLTLDEKDIESIRVQCSEEYHVTEIAKKHYHTSLGNVVVVYVTFIALTTAKLQQQIEASWWIIFLPFWISYGLPFLQYFFICCCSGSVSDADIKAGSNVSGDDIAGTSGNNDNLQTDTGTTVAEEVKNELTTEPESLESSHKNDAELRSSVQWASPDGSMDEFNSPSNQRPQKDGGSSHMVDVTIDNNDDQKPEGTDEESFSRFQHHVQESEQEAMEQKAKAVSGCFNICFQMTMLCLLVAKLEHDYNAYVLNENDGSSDGFSAMWVLFPVFLMSGCVLMLCTCCICVHGSNYTLPDDDPPAQSSNLAQ